MPPPQARERRRGLAGGGEGPGESGDAPGLSAAGERRDGARGRAVKTAPEPPLDLQRSSGHLRMERKQKHLEMILHIVDRLSTNSFLLKGWSVVLVSALFALAAKDAKVVFVYLCYFPAFAFWG